VSEGGTAIVGSSPAFRGALRHLSAVVESTAPVLILGETGTGKELIARQVHELGRRRDGPFVAVNCTAIPRDLFESELFGHSQGAFSGATRAKRGLLEVAHGGTLLLDEVGDLPTCLQAKLLRVLDDQQVRRIGETSARNVDFRLVGATHRDLTREVAAGRFRLDLFYRISTFVLTLPALRERGDDVIDLARHFVTVAAERRGRPTPVLSPAALETLGRYSWPGNVRELANVIERAVAVAHDSVIEPCHLGLGADADRPPRRGSLRDAVAQVVRERVAAALAAHQGNVSAAARELGIARQQLQRLMKKHGVARPAQRLWAPSTVGPD
jgi:transcriptional regulator with PAS, ATPase and Fis domain